MASTLNTTAAHPEGLSLRTDTRPWYRQFWPWFIIALPAISVVAGIATLVIAIRNADEVVSAPGYELSRFAEERPVREARAKDGAEGAATGISAGAAGPAPKLP